MCNKLIVLKDALSLKTNPEKKHRNSDLSNPIAGRPRQPARERIPKGHLNTVYSLDGKGPAPKQTSSRKSYMVLR